MLYSSACEYAIRAATYLALRHGEGELIKLRDIAEAEDIPSPFLSSILQRLVTVGLLRSARGPSGGYALASNPERVTLYDIKAAVDGTADLEACAVGLGACSEEVPCPLHDTWKPIREEIRGYLETTTLEAMAAALERKREDLPGRGTASGGARGSRRKAREG
jgi:Rrf2 family transcriptional regulator, iron-sulfur cluster assembly transcription factor